MNAKGIPEPEIARRSWTFVYLRPKQMGWPLLTQTPLGHAGERGHRKGGKLIPKRVRVVVHQGGSQPVPEVDTVTVTGNWLSNGREAIGIKVHYNSPPGYGLTIYADDNVRELMADAVRRATAEVTIPQEQS